MILLIALCAAYAACAVKGVFAADETAVEPVSANVALVADAAQENKVAAKPLQAPRVLVSGGVAVSEVSPVMNSQLVAEAPMLLAAAMPAADPLPIVLPQERAVEVGDLQAITPKESAVAPASSPERMSLDLKGIDINEFFRVLSMKMGVTIVPTKSVTGRVNIFLNNLTFEDALDVVVFSQDLALERNGNIINVMTAQEYERLYGKKFNEKRKIESCQLVYAKPSVIFEALGQLKSEVGRIIVDESTGSIFMIDIPEKVALMRQTVKDLDRAPVTHVFTLQYAKPADVKAHVSGAITPGIGEMYVDERSNKVIVSDLPQKMSKIRDMIKAFDEPTLQVFIESEIVQVVLKDEFIRGVSWEKLLAQDNLNGLNFKGTFPLATSFTPSPSLSADNLKISIGTMDANNYTAALQFLGTLGNTKVLSEPRIAVLNKEEAKIMVGSREAFVTQALSQGQSTTVTSESIQFIDVGVKLTVLPTINDEGYVMMKIKPEVSTVREVITTALGSRIPIVETSEAESVIKVKDGTMIMIAGLMKDEKREDVTGIPGLSKIPVIGALFGSKGKQKKKTELIIFITPHIITGNAPARGTDASKIVPIDIMPPQIKDDVIDKSIAKIGYGEEILHKTGYKFKETEKKQKPVRKNFLQKSNVRPVAPVDQGPKMKGLKDF